MNLSGEYGSEQGKIELIISENIIYKYMNEVVKMILENKPEYKIYIDYLDKIYSNKFSKKITSEENDINALSLLTEIELGYTLHQLFEDVKYEPTINGKKPDWLVNSFGENLIFEVRKINPLEKDVTDTITRFKNGEYFGNTRTTFSFSQKEFEASMGKIIAKEESYRSLITEDNYKLLVYFDVVMLPCYCLTKDDFRGLFDFDKPTFPLSKYPTFIENVSGILAKPNFGGKVFISNNQSKYLLNNENLKILENLNEF